jgi:hypothetical protein
MLWLALVIAAGLVLLLLIPAVGAKKDPEAEYCAAECKGYRK